MYIIKQKLSQGHTLSKGTPLYLFSTKGYILVLKVYILLLKVYILESIFEKVLPQ